MNLETLFQLLPTSVWVGLIISVVIPHLSALATKAPTYLTGVITTGLAAVTGFVSEFANSLNGSTDFQWKSALGVALVSWAIAMGVQRGWISGSDAQTLLHSKGLALGGKNLGEVTDVDLDDIDDNELDDDDLGEVTPTDDDPVAAPIAGPITAAHAQTIVTGSVPTDPVPTVDAAIEPENVVPAAHVPEHEAPETAEPNDGRPMPF